MTSIILPIELRQKIISMAIQLDFDDRWGWGDSINRGKAACCEWCSNWNTLVELGIMSRNIEPPWPVRGSAKWWSGRAKGIPDIWKTQQITIEHYGISSYWVLSHGTFVDQTAVKELVTTQIVNQARIALLGKHLQQLMLMD